MGDPRDRYEPKTEFDGQPLYFERSFGGREDQPTEAASGHFDFILDMRQAFQDEPLKIYGYSMVSSYPEDVPIARKTWDSNRAFLSYCFSKVVPDGEMGFTSLSEVDEITKEEFEEAMAKGWR